MFLALAVAVYFALPGVRTRTAWLLVLSLGFYLLLSPMGLAVLVGITALTYVLGRLLDSAQAQTSRKAVLSTGLVAVIGTLAYFKYSGSLAALAGELSQSPFASLLPAVRIALPIGISFWTFQTVAYLVDVYRGKIKAERNPFLYALAVTFFPVVTSGPITRIQDLAASLREKHRFDIDRLQPALLLIARGFFKKLMVADRLAVFTSPVFADPRHIEGPPGPVLLLAALCFSIQIYCDFSGYTDIVRGSARLFGVELPINFRAPYLAASVRDFWRRWHITLMDWLREYVYIPLGGNRKGTTRRYINLLAVFLVSGLWHGTGLTFLAWGALNGAYVMGEGLLEPMKERFLARTHTDRESPVIRALGVLVTFLLITVAWVFFRANTLADAWYILTHLFLPGPGAFDRMGLPRIERHMLLASIAVVALADYWTTKGDVLGWLNRRALPLRWLTYATVLFLLLVFGRYGGHYNAADFIYFKF
jgi:D-alanyl-lipoteichoic acid acyltransferase DltB (MBOAT superfamily)